MLDDLTKKDAWKAEFERSPKLQAEFVTVENYVAFMAANAEGLIRILHH